MKKTCITCNTLFSVSPSEVARGAKYCSRVCIQRTKSFSKVCKVCSEPFKAAGPSAKYCSELCKSHSRGTSKCLNCNSEFGIRPVKNGETNEYCSVACLNMYKRGTVRVSANGRIRVNVGSDYHGAASDGRIDLARFVWQESTGERLKSSDRIFHVNGDKRDCAMSNLKKVETESRLVEPGVSLSSEGYVVLYLPEHEMARSNGTVLEHRKVVAEDLGRPLDASETVHHIDGNKLNNELSNLQLRSGRHGKGVAQECADCGSHNIVSVTLS